MSTEGVKPNRTLVLFVSITILFLLPVSLVNPGYNHAKIFTTGHAAVSTAIAVNEVVCNKRSMLSNEYLPIMEEIFLGAKNLEIVDYKHLTPQLAGQLRNKPLRSFYDFIPGLDKTTYCQSVDSVYQNNENTLVHVTKSLLELDKDLSTTELETYFSIFRLIMIISVGFICMRLGFSRAWSTTVAVVLAVVNYHLTARYALSIYPFMPICSVFYASVLALVLKSSQKRYVLPLGAVFAGVFGACLFNIRTSYLPLVVLSFFILIAAFIFMNSNKRVAVNKALIVTIIFFVCFSFAHQNIFSLHAEGAVMNKNYHTVYHSLVLGLANSENPVAKREKLNWEDFSGFEVAKRVAPNLKEYRSAAYDDALELYYKKLWKNNTVEMLSVYTHRMYVVFQDIVNKAIYKLVPEEYMSSYFEWEPPVSVLSLLLVYVVGFFYALRAIVNGNNRNLALAMIVTPLAGMILAKSLYFGGLSYLFYFLLTIAHLIFNETKPEKILLVTLLVLGGILNLFEALIIHPRFTMIYFSLFSLSLFFVSMYWFGLVLQNVKLPSASLRANCQT